MGSKGHSDEVSTEMGNMLLENGETVVLVIKWQKEKAELCSYSNVLWKVELESTEN